MNPDITNYKKYMSHNYCEQDLIKELKRVGEYLCQNTESCVKEHYANMNKLCELQNAKNKDNTESSHCFKGATMESILKFIFLEYRANIQNRIAYDKYQIDYDIGMDITNTTTVYDKNKKQFVTA